MRCEEYISQEAFNLDSPYKRHTDSWFDPLLLFAKWECGGTYEDVALSLWEERVMKLAVSGRTHKQHTHSPHLLVLPTDGDDLHFDAFDAILDTLTNSREERALPLLKSAHKLFRQHFDIMTEKHPDKAMEFAMALSGRITWRTGNHEFDQESAAFREDILGMISTCLVEKLSKVNYGRGTVDVVQFVLENSHDEGTISLAVGASVRRFEENPTSDGVNRLLRIAKKIGEEHPSFHHIAELIVDQAASQAGGRFASIESCLQLTELMQRKTPLRFKTLRTAKTFTETLGEDYPLEAERYFDRISKLCTAKREHAKIALDITTRIVPTITQVRPLDVGEKATMDGMLAKLAMK